MGEEREREVERDRKGVRQRSRKGWRGGRERRRKGWR